MKSAYLTLGVPANASADEIHEAFERVKATYTREKLATDEGALFRFNEARTAYQVLRDPETRAAHDRKLTAPRPAAPRRPTPVVVDDGGSSIGRLLRVGITVMVLLFVVGGFLSWRNAERRAEAAAAEKAATELRIKEEKERAEAQARADAERAEAAARAEEAERRRQAESRAIGAEASWRNARAEEQLAEARRREALQQEHARAMEERRQQYEARARIEADKRRVRELCIQGYGRANC